MACIIKEKMVDICKTAFYNKLFSGTSGNLSFFDREGDVLYITPTSVRYETLTPDDIVCCTLDGKIISEKSNPSSELKMHAVIYKEMECVNAVFHTHSSFATAFAAVRQPIPEFLIEMKPFLNGGIPVASFAQAGSEKLGKEASGALIGHKVNGCLLANHGVVTVGGSLDEAFIRAEYVEDAAKIYYFAKQLGEPIELN